MLDNETIKSGAEFITATITAIKSIVGLADKTTNLEMKRQSVEALEKVIEAKQKYLELQEGYFDLVRQNRELTEEIKKAKSYEFHHSVTWRKLDDGTEDGPLCPICWADTKRESRLQLMGRTNDGKYRFRCYNHANPDYVIPSELIKKDRYVITESPGAARSWLPVQRCDVRGASSRRDTAIGPTRLGPAQTFRENAPSPESSPRALPQCTDR